jgi:hypothetical protein
MTNRFERRTARNTKAMLRLQRWQADRQAKMDAVALAHLRATVRSQLRELQDIPPRPDQEY